MHRYSVNIEQVEQDDMMHVLLSRDTPRIWSLIRIIAHHRGLASFMSPAHFRRLRPFLTIPTKLYRKNDTSENFQSHRDAKSSRNITIKSASFFTVSEQTCIRERRRDVSHAWGILKILKIRWRKHSSSYNRHKMQRRLCESFHRCILMP